MQFPHFLLPGVPIMTSAVHAGFPSPADDYAEGRIDLNERLIEQPDATHLVRVKSDAMLSFGIHPGDTLVVDRSMTASDRDVIIAVVDGEFYVRQFCRLPQGVLLRAGNPAYQDILVDEEQEATVWGVVSWSLHPIKRRN